MSWTTFVRSHAHLIAAADFFTTEVWTARGLVTHYTLFVIDIATRRVHIAGTTTNPISAWMEQIARNLTAYQAPNMNAFAERSHQGIGKELISGAQAQRLGEVEVKRRLGGLLNDYHRRAA